MSCYLTSEFTSASVKDFMINNGGRVKNHQLVTYFKAFLNDPIHKAHNREKFKDFVNELATIKVEEGEKVLVLKKKFRPEAGPVSAVKSGDVPRAQSEPPSNPPPYPPDRDNEGSMSKGRSEGSLEKGSVTSAGSDTVSINSLAMSTTSITSTESQGSGKSSLTSTEDDQNVSVVSVKDRAKHLNRIQSQSDVLITSPGNKKEFKSSRGSGGDDDDSQSGTSYVTLEPEEREWMLTCCKADYHEMNRLLSKNTSLAKLKNFTNGYTALHWACKHGKPEVIKLVASKPGVNINGRSHGGYTPLHIAAIHGHEEIIALLIQTFKADANVRDYSGKKAKQYLKNSASTKAQQLLVSRSLQSDVGSGRSLDDTFMRTVSFRKSHRHRAISSLLQATSSIVRQQTFRSSWDGSEKDKTTPDSTPPSSSKSSPAMPRKGSFSGKDRDLMPPPSAPSRKKKVTASNSGENISYDSQPKLGTRSESDPALTTHSAKQTFI